MLTSIRLVIEAAVILRTTPGLYFSIPAKDPAHFIQFEVAPLYPQSEAWRLYYSLETYRSILQTKFIIIDENPRRLGCLHCLLGTARKIIFNVRMTIEAGTVRA